MGKILKTEGYELKKLFKNFTVVQSHMKTNL